jgi:hypothetical protein
MKKTILIAALLLVFGMLALSFAMAEQSSDNGTGNNDDVNESGNPNLIAKTPGNGTYGQCVAAAAKLRNECYASMKNISASCSANTTRAERAKCLADSKKDMASCKADFKSIKGECRKIKHNFFETMRYAFA